MPLVAKYTLGNFSLVNLAVVVTSCNCQAKGNNTSTLFSLIKQEKWQSSYNLASKIDDPVLKKIVLSTSPKKKRRKSARSKKTKTRKSGLMKSSLSMPNFENDKPTPHTPNTFDLPKLVFKKGDGQGFPEPTNPRNPAPTIGPSNQQVRQAPAGWEFDDDWVQAAKDVENRTRQSDRESTDL